jgi:hypothetical protein
MKHTYCVRIQPHRYYSLIAAGAGPLTAQSLANAIEGAAVREITQGDRGDQIVDLQLQRSSHEEALNEILVVVQQLGYAWLEATVTEWADNTVGGALIGFVGGGTAGSTSEDGAVSLGLAVIGSLIGAVIGSFIERERVVYVVHWNGSGWVLTPLAPAPTPTPLAQPRLA